MTPSSQFSAELEVFELHRREWALKHPGEFVVIQDSTVAEGFFRTYAEALKAGLQNFGANRHFLVKQIWITEPVYLV
jgi:hypothetical protein